MSSLVIAAFMIVVIVLTGRRAEAESGAAA